MLPFGQCQTDLSHVHPDAIAITLGRSDDTEDDLT